MKIGIRKYVILIALLSFSCCGKNYDYKIKLPDDEYKILRHYVNRHRYIRSEISLKKEHGTNYVFSNNKELLVKIRNRAAGMNGIRYSHGPATPIIIHYMDKNYHASSFAIASFDWLNDEELYKELLPFNGIQEIRLNLLDKWNNITKDEFIEMYFEPIDNNTFRSKIIIEPLILFKRDIEKEQEKLFETILFLSITKYNLYASVRERTIIIEEIIMEAK